MILSIAAALPLLPAVSAPVDPPFINHLMQIYQVVGGVNGDTTAQAIELRMRFPFQNQVSGTRLIARDAQGLNPVTIITFLSNVTFQGTDRRILVTSTSFDATTTPATSSDFTMTNLIPASYLAAGTLTFEEGLSTYWRISWGGAGYTGPTTGAFDNDNNGDFGPAFPGPLPSTSSCALQFQGPATALSTNNADDYALSSGPGATVTNNANASFTVSAAPTASAQVVRAGTPPNPVAFNPGTQSPIIGTTWNPSITPFLPGAFIDFAANAAGVPLNVPTSLGTLLCNVPPPALIVFGVPNVPFAISVPNDCSLIGLPRCVQGGSVAPGPVIALSNALDITIGTF